MIQELFGGGAAGLINQERKISISGILEASPSPSPSPSSSTTTPTTSTTTSENQNLRCPRCDSSNTKFCYYNNYNLTQPRHFCKTCRRYWTKGGALRNVPIGGGCRKNKGSTVTTPVMGKPICTGKLKSVVSSEIGKSGYVTGFENELNSNPILWAGPSQSSHLLALLRATQNPNLSPNPNFATNSVTVKDEGFLIGSNMTNNSDALSAGNLGYDPMGQNPSIGLCSSFWRNNNQNQAQQNHHDQQQQQNGGLIIGEVQNTGTLGGGQMYQRLRSSPTNYYHPDHTPVILGNVGCSSSTPSSTILESAPVAGGELGFWNPTLSWSDLPTTNGAYP